MNEGSAEKVNMAFIAAIVAVATIGGFMFGYDSGVINGTQKGLESAFDLGKLGIVGTWLYILPLCWYEPVFRVLEHIWRVCGEI